MPTGGWDSARHVLCVRLDSLGDVLMTTPAIRAIKEARPDRRITLLTSPAGGRLAGLIPEVDDYLIYESPWMKATPHRANPQHDLEMIARLANGHFDGAVIFTVFSQNPLPAAMLCYLAGIPRRLAHCRENAYQLLTDRIPEFEPEARIRHEVRRQLDLVESIGCRTHDERLSLRVPAGLQVEVARTLSRRGLRLDAPWIVVHPGASAPSRRYPPERFTEAALTLGREHDVQLVFTGSPAERELVESVCAPLTRLTGQVCISLAGELELPQLAALISLSPLLLTNNTGPAHMAAALGTPVVDLYALTNPQHTPWMVPHRVLSYDVDCKYCFKSECPLEHHDCLRRLEPQTVVQAVLDLLAETASRRVCEVGECEPGRTTADSTIPGSSAVDLEENCECIP